MFEFAKSLREFARAHGVLIALVALAIVFYAIGFKKGSMIAVALGMLFELGFWVKLFRRDRRS
jgi:hypothetical protein